MSVPKETKVSLEEFYKLREDTDRLLEFVDGVVFMTPSPSTIHQRISGRLHAQLFNLLEGKECEVFHAPFDVQLSRDDEEEKQIVVPDLSVICDKKGLGENKYVGSPTMIFEIISPSNQAHDLVFKLNLYMHYGVQEYWIVNPLLKTVQIYAMNEGSQYQQKDIVKQKGHIQSGVLSDFNVDVEKLFS